VITVPGVTDIVSGFAIFRLIALRNAFRIQAPPMLTTEGWAANAELYDRTARHARRLETINAIERGDLRQRPSRISSWDAALRVLRSRGPLRQLPAWPSGTEPGSPRETTQQAEVGSA
jgi:hypothetical protein